MQNNDTFEGKSVYIIDDSKFVRESLVKLFHHMKMKAVGHTSDGFQALEEIQTLSPDLVTIDIIMPNIHGVEVFKRVKARYPSLKIIFMSCMGGDPQVKEALKGECSPNHIFAKPTSTEEMGVILASLYGIEGVTSLKTALAPAEIPEAADADFDMKSA